ncbi:MAG: low molecular weight phosphotyrosine protein phosphatase [Rhodospirillales bacterium]|nr:low molecular weight phosphotyrosine protein phosphatase [Rhodospirillales bacterium]
MCTEVNADLPAVNVLFVCLGNICRSPTAEGVFAAASARAGLAGQIGIDSAGTHVWQVGRPPEPRAQAIAKARGAELGHLRARQVRSEDFQTFEYVIAMDRRNRADLAAICPAGYEDRLHLLLDFADGTPVRDVPDPFGNSEAAFERTFELIEAGVAGLLAHIRNAHFRR